MDIKQVTETIAMIEEQNFDVRTITMGISLLDCIDSDINKAADIRRLWKKRARWSKLEMRLQLNWVFQL